MQHQTTAKHATEVSTLDGVQQTACIDRTEAVLLPKVFSLILFRQCIIVILTDSISYRIWFFINSNILLTHIFQLKVSALTVGQCLIFLQRDLIVHTIIVRTIVGDIQLTVTTHHRQVTTAIESTYMFCTYGDEVTVIDIIECGGRVSEYCDGVGKTLSVRRYVTTGKDSIVDMNTTFYGVVVISSTISFFVTSEQISPSAVRLFCRQCIQVFGRHIFIGSIVHTKITNALTRLHLQHRCNNHLTVLCQIAITIFIINMVGRSCILFRCCPFTEIAGTIDIAHVTATEHIAVAASTISL